MKYFLKIISAFFVLACFPNAWSKNMPVIQGTIKGGQQKTIELPPFNNDYIVLNINLTRVNLAQQGISIFLCRRLTSSDEPRNCRTLAKDVTRQVEKHLLINPKQHY